jgi:hypothetical protein
MIIVTVNVGSAAGSLNLSITFLRISAIIPPISLRTLSGTVSPEAAYAFYSKYSLRISRTIR